MKKIILVIMGIVLLSSCKNEQEKVMDKCEEAFIAKLNDPSSYERISISVSDTVTKSEKMEILAQIRKPLIEPTPVSSIYESLGDFYREMKEDYTKDSLEYVVGMNKYDSTMAEVKSLRSNPQMDSAYFYVVEIECRAKNAMGALVVGTSEVSYNTRTGECTVSKRD